MMRMFYADWIHYFSYIYFLKQDKQQEEILLIKKKKYNKYREIIIVFGGEKSQNILTNRFLLRKY